MPKGTRLKEGPYLGGLEHDTQITQPQNSWRMRARNNEQSFEDMVSGLRGMLR